MRFHTDRPFYPYREPSDQRTNTGLSRRFRLFLITEGRVDGAIGKARTHWPARLKFAAPLKTTHFLEGVADETLPRNAWLSAYLDRSSPRPGLDDLFFTSSPDSSELRPEPTIFTSPRFIPIPLDLLWLGALGWFGVRQLRKRQARKKTA